MKFTLGRVTLILLLCSSFIFANSNLASYKLSANKNRVSIKEPLLITFKAHQKDHTDHMFFTLTPQKSKDYEITLLKKEIDDSNYHDSKIVFTYLLFALTPTQLHINFKFTIKTASDQAIKQSYVDDHDDSIAISTYDTKLKIEPLELNVVPLEHPVDLVGDFQLSSTLDKKSISAFEDLNLHYTLSGTGYHANNLQLLTNTNQNITLFQEVHDTLHKVTKEGYKIKKEFIYAFTANDDFTIPAVSLRVYSPTKKSYYTLKVPQQSIKVTKIDTKKLLDKENYPQGESIDIKLYKEIFIAFIIFFAGFLTAKMSEKVSFRRRNRAFEDIKKAQSAQALTLLLLNKYKNYKIDDFIDELERMEYKKVYTNLKDIKSRIIKKFM